MSYGYPPYDPARAPPPHGYYPPPHGYAPPQSPTEHPPARPHTTAPYPSQSQYAPPPANYYPPQPNGHPSPPTGPPSTAGSGYPPPTPSSGKSTVNQYENMSPEEIQGVIDHLRNVKINKSSPASKPAAPARGDEQRQHAAPPVPPPIDTSMPPPPAPQSARGPPPYPYPFQYPYTPHYRPGPASHGGETSPPTHHNGHAHAPAPTKAPSSMPGSFYPEAPAPPQPTAAAAPPKTPGPGSGRPEAARKPSEAASEASFVGGAAPKHADMAQAWELWGGGLVEISAGREPRPKPRLVSLFRGIAGYMIALLEPHHSCVVTLEKLMQFYSIFRSPDDLDWQRFFNMRSPQTLSELFCALNVEHHFVPSKPNQTPSTPGLTPKGFEVWMFTQLMAAPDREWARISHIINRWNVLLERGVESPKVVPRECFPPSEDTAIFKGWWRAVDEDFPEDAVGPMGLESDGESDIEDRKIPLPLPEPEKRRRGYSMRGGDLTQDPPLVGATAGEAKEEKTAPAPPNLTRKRTSRPYALHGNSIDPHDFLTEAEKESPPLERYRHPYASGPNPGWRDETSVNPRPTLGEEPVPRPPTRSRSVKPKKDTRRKRAQSMHRSRRDDSASEDDEDYGRRFEGDGLYSDEDGRGGYHEHGRARRGGGEKEKERDREREREREKERERERDISEYTYQEQYERDARARRGARPGGEGGRDKRSSGVPAGWRGYVG